MALQYCLCCQAQLHPLLRPAPSMISLSLHRQLVAGSGQHTSYGRPLHTGGHIIGYHVSNEKLCMASSGNRTGSVAGIGAGSYDWCVSNTTPAFDGHATRRGAGCQVTVAIKGYCAHRTIEASSSFLPSWVNTAPRPALKKGDSSIS